jgi:hypothetical protein
MQKKQKQEVNRASTLHMVKCEKDQKTCARKEIKRFCTKGGRYRCSSRAAVPMKEDGSAQPKQSEAKKTKKAFT